MAFDPVKIQQEATYRLQTSGNRHESYNTAKISLSLSLTWKGNPRDHLRIKVYKYFRSDNIAVTYQDNVKNINQHTCKFLSQEQQ
jgi:hypothetical protein